MWNYLCCPSCDCMWTFSLEPGTSASLNTSADELSAAVPTAPEAKADTWKLDRFFGEVDKFWAFVSSLGTVADRTEIKQQLDFVASSKERLKLAQAEELARIKACRDKLQAQREVAKQKQEARRKQMEECNKPPLPLDPYVLGQALLKNLGLNT